MYGFSGSGSVGADSKEGDRSLSGKSSSRSAPSDKEGDRSLSGRTASPGPGSMERGRSVDRAGVTGYAGNSKTHEQDIAERHAERADHVARAGVGVTPAGRAGRMSTNVEVMTAQDIANQRARQIGGLVAQTNAALRSNDLMSPFGLANTYDTRYRPQAQNPLDHPYVDPTQPFTVRAAGFQEFEPTTGFGIAAHRGFGFAFNPRTGLAERIR